MTDILSRLEAVEKKLEAMLEKPPAQDPRSWVGMWGFMSDTDHFCPDDGVMFRLAKYGPYNDYPFKDVDDDCWRYFRPATHEELQQIHKDNL